MSGSISIIKINQRVSASSLTIVMWAYLVIVFFLELKNDFFTTLNLSYDIVTQCN